MRVGCNTIHPTDRLGDETVEFRAYSICKSLELIADAGFDAAEFSHMTHLTADECETIRGKLEELRLQAWSGHAWQPLPGKPDDIEAALEGLAPSMTNAERLGCEVIVVHSAGFDAEAGEEAIEARRQANVFVLRQLCEQAARFGASIAVENMQYRRDWEFVVDMVRSSGMPNAGLNVDTGHAHIGDLQVEPAVRMGGELVITTHLQDNHGGHDEHLPPGRGTIDWLGCLAALRDVGYSGVLMVEITDRPSDRPLSPAEDIHESHDSVQGFLKQLSW